ncbi:CACTA en-spm transposon protein [Cucumis melo var. makuwa]|uniref:CACTA en-spm transposon protein n=1 Tax=Cucumis melo var. makuwa TaxID=1194695 RepID=A0A5A7VJN8_CUCMM|nr:CACTA en-spm transposon protein [Cucumis melo var. makuwa]TYK26521.1 CACTA en-spm transposon protein [Cucumis melo var. makuwa]
MTFGVIIGESNASGSGDNNFYDILDKVLHVQYLMEKSVWLFKCRWYDTDNNKSQMTHVELGTMSSFPSSFEETNHMVLKFSEDLSTMGGNYSTISNPRRRAQSQLLELESMPMTDVGREYIEVVKDDIHHYFVLDFNDPAMNRFVEYQMLTCFKEFEGNYHKHFKKIKCWNSSPRLPYRVFSHSLGMRYVRPFWVDNRAIRKVLVEDPIPSHVRRLVLAVP